MTLLAAATVMYSGFVAYQTRQRPVFDRIGWAGIALTALPFWYWGLVEPNGAYRSAVFSIVAAGLYGRIAQFIWRTPRSIGTKDPQRALALVFGIATLWMAARGIYYLLAEAAPLPARGDNPTTWVAVFWYIILVSLITACVIWMELSRLGPSDGSNHVPNAASNRGAAFSWVGYFRNRLHLLWAMVLVLALGIVSEAGLFYARAFESEQVRLDRTSELTNDAFAQHTRQVIGHVDTILHAVRNVYRLTGSASQTERFINTLPFDRSTIDNVYLINAQGLIDITHDPVAIGRSVADRDYFKFLQSSALDHIFIGSVESGRITGKFHFRVVRRISKPDGSFGGLVLATVNPRAFSRYYQELALGLESTATLFGTMDKKLRARAPEPPDALWQVAVASPLWDLLEQAPAGSYRNESSVDQIQRVFHYKQVADLPLVMVTGFSQADVRAIVQNRMRWLLAGLVTVLGIVLTLAWLLTLEIRRRNEQDDFMSMLSHELKTPLSVLRIALGSPDGALSHNTRTLALQSVQDMDSIIYRCLQVDRLQQRGNAAVLQHFQLGELLADLQTASAQPTRLQIAASDLPTIRTDPQLLSIALNNLIHNALRYSPPQSMVQITAVREAQQRRAGIRVDVSNGVGQHGMPDAQRVFKKFYRGAGAHRTTGSGLGLYLVHSVMGLLGGSVRYAPGQDQVRFEIWFPQ